MSTLTFSQVETAVLSAYQTAADQNPAQPVSAVPIGDNATLQTDVYSGLNGIEFQVLAKITLGIRSATLCKPGLPTTVDTINAEQKTLRAAAYVERGCSDLDYVDAVTKQSSSDMAIKAAGDAQLAAVLAARLKIKTDYPYIS